MRLLPLLLAASLAACHVQGPVAVTHHPDLVYAGPGVQVIADYDEPIFYADGYYWWFVDGYWYRSMFYTGGWTFVPSPPLVVVRIDNPIRYRHYRPAGYIVHHRPVPVRQVKRPVVRDHRADATRVRDHRR
jgi:hypothetical protein